MAKPKARKKRTPTHGLPAAERKQIDAMLYEFLLAVGPGGTFELRRAPGGGSVPRIVEYGRQEGV
jgi:hypothetical protein